MIFAAPASVLEGFSSFEPSILEDYFLRILVPKRGPKPNKIEQIRLKKRIENATLSGHRFFVDFGALFSDFESLLEVRKS